MNEETGGDVTGQGGGDVVEEQSSGLPSEQPTQEEINGFTVSAEDLKDGKYQGRWSNPQEMADYIKQMEDKHAELNRNISDEKKQQDADIQKTAEEVQRQQLQSDTIKELAPDFLANGMQLTDDMMSRLQETGLTEQEIKLGAYELKEAMDRNASYVGGKENYDIIMDYHAQNMSDDEKRAFNHSLQDPNNHEALMVGLQAMYERSVNGGQPQPQDRVRGNGPANTNSIQPYASKRELLQDKAYADSRASSQADKARFRARLAATPNDVWQS